MPIVANEKECLSGIVRIRTWLAHVLSNYFDAAVYGGRCMVNFDGYPLKRKAIQIRERGA